MVCDQINGRGWGDRLTADGLNTYTYDAVGNPLNYNGYTLEWNGRQLVSMTNGSTTNSFKYNDEGIRTSKTVGGVEHIYTLDGSRIISESWSNVLVVYLYDENGSPIGMQYHTTFMEADTFYTFYFEKNLQGDIVAVYNESGEKVFGYNYDAWGNFTTTYYSTIGTNYYAYYNPFRYRGYYYDSETGLYYLQSRYYNPQWGRFISADIYVNANGDLIGFNMYAYCSNNPVMYVDPTGEFILTALIVGVVVGVVVGGAIGGTIAYNAAKSEGLEGSDLAKATLTGVGKGALIGGGAGGLIGLSIGFGFTVGLTSVAGYTIISGASTLVLNAVEIGVLQSRKSLADGKNGWQAAKDSMDSIIHNFPKTAVSIYTKVGTSVASYAGATHRNAHHVSGAYSSLPWGAHMYSKSALGAAFSYVLLAPTVIYTASAFFCDDPAARAFDRGYVLK